MSLKRKRKRVQCRARLLEDWVDGKARWIRCHLNQGHPSAHANIIEAENVTYWERRSKVR